MSKIVSLQCSNFARIKAVEIRPDGALVQISGKNSNGKTSVLRAIWTALKGRTAAPPAPIHDGAERAVIKLDTGDLAIVRTFSKKKGEEITSDLTVTAADGRRIHNKPQQMLDALLGDLSFDPLAFSKLPAKDQFDKLKRLVVDVDFDEIAQRRQALYDARTDSNRKHKDAVARAAGIKLPPGPEPKAVDVAGLMVEVSKANTTNNWRRQLLDRIKENDAAAERMLDEAESLRSRAIGLEQNAQKLKAANEELRPTVPVEISTLEITEAIANSHAIADVRRLHQTRREYLKIADAAEAESLELTRKIDASDLEARTAIAAAKLPAGLTLDIETSTVMLNGLPFASAGTAEKIIASAEAAMAMNPTLRVMLIDEGSELDQERLAALSNLAEANDYQVWLASVAQGEGGPGFRIEDGRNAE